MEIRFNILQIVLKCSYVTLHKLNKTYRIIQNDEPNIVCFYFLNYGFYMNDDKYI